MKRFLLSNLFLFFLGITASFAQYNQGFLIANEGNYGESNASVSYFDFGTHQVTNGIYSAVNDEPLGDILQHIGLHNDKAYLVINNSDKVVIVDRTTFQKLATITDGISQPRYVAFADNKYFVTNSASKMITVYDVATNNKVAEIASTGDKIIENIVSIGNKIFVMQAKPWEKGNSIMVIDAVNHTALETITVNDSLQWIYATDDKLYALCSDESPHTDFYEINPDDYSIIRTLSTDTYKAGWKMTISDGVLYFIANENEVYAMPLEATALPESPVFTVGESSWSTFYGFNVINGILLRGDVKEFMDASEVSAYVTANWSPMGTPMETGMGTNGFYLNKESNGVDEMLYSTLKLYPNPTQNNFTIIGVQQATVKIHNINGQVCKRLYGSMSK